MSLRPFVVLAFLATGCATLGWSGAPRSVGRISFQEGGGDDARGKRRFAFELFDDGTLSFEGTECVPALGRHIKSLPAARFDRMARLFDKDCAAVAPVEACAGGDVVRVVCRGVEKYEQTTCAQTPPSRSLDELVVNLVDAADLHEWSGPRGHTCKPP